MKDLIIVCEDMFGMDVRMIVETYNRFNEPLYRFKGFIGPEDMPMEYRERLTPFLGTVEQWQPDPDECYAMGIVEPARKEKYVVSMKENGARFVTVRAPWGSIPDDMQFGEGCIIAAYSILTSAQIGNFVTLFDSMVGYDAVVGDYASIMGYSNITTAHIEEGAYIGANCAVMSHKTVGRRAKIMAGSIVVNNVKPGTAVAGVPARRIKEKSVGQLDH